MNNTKIELFKDNQWIPIEISMIKQGNRFRIVNKYTNIVMAEKVALKDAFLDTDGEWKVNIGVMEE